MSDIQYFIGVEKGMTVTYGNKCYRVYDDGKGHHLHIIVFEKGKRKKISIETLHKQTTFEPGTEADWAINGWWRIYPEYELYRDFALAEVAWINN